MIVANWIQLAVHMVVAHIVPITGNTKTSKRKYSPMKKSEPTSLKQLVEQHGFGITVCCGLRGYPQFTIVSQKDRFYLVKYSDGTTCFVSMECETTNDYIKI